MNKLFNLLSIGLLTFGLAACSPNNNTEQEEIQKKETNQPKQESENTQTPSESVFASNEFFTSFDGKIDHIHGLGYAGNQNAVFFAAHDGLKVYENGQWFKTKKENNDYMGFNAVKSGFYSSGHPGADSNLPNPIGIKKSQDNGKTLENLGLEGEIDFHAMGVGYENNVIFVMNPQKSSIMNPNKYYISEDDAKTWKEVSAKGIQDEIMSIAVHPTNPEFIAIVGKAGIYLSKNKGESFELITEGLQGTAVFFTEDNLYYGAYNGDAMLVKRSIANGSEDKITLPKMKQDAVMYLAQNPKNSNEITFASFNGDIYQTQDGANTWNLIVKAGEIQ
jgi:hypothetical protein